MREKSYGRHRDTVLLGLVAALCGLAGCIPPVSAAGDTTAEDEQVVVVPASDDGAPSQFALTGKTAEFGRYIASGEITYVGGEQEGAQSGTGIAIVQAEDGAVIVADVSSDPLEDGSTSFTFHWRDSVMFSDGTVVETTGRFVEDRPPGLVRRYVCSNCCTRVCALPPFNDCRYVCVPCNCRYVFVSETRSPPGLP